MNKEKLIALWNGKDWDTAHGIYFTGQYNGHDLYISFTGYTEDNVLAISDDFWNSLITKLEELDRQAHTIIQDDAPEEDASELVLTDLMFDKSGCYGAFALGYDTGDSPVGRLYILIKFDHNFHPDENLIYEAY